jgi:Sulfocyanin (SoxE) domain
MLSDSTEAGLLALHTAKNDKRWLKINRKTRHVVITVIVGLTGANNGFNFDGYANGKANFVVPLDWTVQLKFSNHADIPHSLAVANNHGNSPTLATIGGKHVQSPHPAR